MSHPKHGLVLIPLAPLSSKNCGITRPSPAKGAHPYDHRLCITDDSHRTIPRAATSPLSPALDRLLCAWRIAGPNEFSARRAAPIITKFWQLAPLVSPRGARDRMLTARDKQSSPRQSIRRSAHSSPTPPECPLTCGRVWSTHKRDFPTPAARITHDRCRLPDSADAHYRGGGRCAARAADLRIRRG